MKKVTYTIIFIGILLFSLPISAQREKRADKYFKSYSYQKAIELYEIQWKKDSLNEHITKRIADSYRLINKTEEAEQWYSRVVEMKDVNDKDIFHYARALQSNKKYSEAEIWMNKYLERNSESKVDRINQEYIANLLKDSTRYKIKRVKANSEASDFGVCFYKNQIVFSSARERNSLIKRTHKWNNQDYLRLYKANINDDGELIETKRFENKIATNFHDGPVCFNNKGNEMFLTRNHVSNSKRIKRNKEGIVSIKLYDCRKENNKWSRPKLLPFNIKGYSTGHPAISPDGKSIYFISDRPGGFGGTDLYVCHRKGTNWGIVQNLGPNINTSENEMFPYITKNGKLFFASKGHAGLGGLDIFSVNLKNKNTKPTNLGYPINTSKDDFGLIIRNGKGYFSSNRVKGESYDDIYHFIIASRILIGEVYNSETDEILGETQVSLSDEYGTLENIISTGKDGRFKFMIPVVKNYKVKSEKERFTNGDRIIPASELQNKTDLSIKVYQAPDNNLYLDGLVLLKTNQNPIHEMEIILQDIQNKEKIHLLSDTLGKFSCQLKRETGYNIEYKKDGFMSKYDQINTLKLPKNNIYVCEEFNKLHIGQILFNDILYDLDKSNIREDAIIKLNKLVTFMESNPRLIIELNSHTDSRGSHAYNFALSNRRAKSASEYIISKGISADRVMSKGYGETMLINHNSNEVNYTEEEHQANRRTEVKVIDF